MFKDLVLANRSYRGFDRTRPVSREELLSFIDLARQTPSGGNLQPLRYRMVTDARETAAVQALSRWGAALPELHLPFPGTEAPAFVLLCADKNVVKDAAACGPDVGIAAQTLLLAAAEQGLGGLMIQNFDKAKTAEALKLPENLLPALLIAVGKPCEKVVLEEAEAGQSLKYYRDAEGAHHVPKRRLEDVVIG